MLSENAQAGQLLEHAKVQAAQLLNEAAQQRDTLLEQAQLAFWKQANAQLQKWEHQRQNLCDKLEHYATSIADQALCCLLDEIPPAQRICALIKQLMATQLPTAHATLLCHPHELASMEQCLAMQGITRWDLRPDDRIEPESMVLETVEGDFRIDWASMQKMLLTRDEGLSNS